MNRLHVSAFTRDGRAGSPPGLARPSEGVGFVGFWHFSFFCFHAKRCLTKVLSCSYPFPIGNQHLFMYSCLSFKFCFSNRLCRLFRDSGGRGAVRADEMDRKCRQKRPSDGATKGRRHAAGRNPRSGRSGREPHARLGHHSAFSTHHFARSPQRTQSPQRARRGRRYAALLYSP